MTERMKRIRRLLKGSTTLPAGSGGFVTGAHLHHQGHAHGPDCCGHDHYHEHHHDEGCCSHGHEDDDCTTPGGGCC